MVDYQKLYYIMVEASEKALEELEQANYGNARKILIEAEESAEEQYMNSCEQEETH